MDEINLANLFRNEPNTWPDGTPIHKHNVFVKLICGHHRVSEGWRGSAGEMINCERCNSEKKFGLKLIMATIITDAEPYDWREPE